VNDRPFVPYLDCVKMLLRQLDEGLEWARTRVRWDTDRQRQELLSCYEKAREVLLKRAGIAIEEE
jgi:hypothetical protein